MNNGARCGTRLTLNHECVNLRAFFLFVDGVAESVRLAATPLNERLNAQASSSSADIWLSLSVTFMLFVHGCEWAMALVARWHA